jgi:hypothetical protein
MRMILFENLKDQKVEQIGYLYKDAKKQAKKMEETLGMPSPRLPIGEKLLRLRSRLK